MSIVVVTCFDDIEGNFCKTSKAIAQYKLNPYGAFWIKPVVTKSYRMESPFYFILKSQKFFQRVREFMYIQENCSSTQLLKMLSKDLICMPFCLLDMFNRNLQICGGLQL
jgi:hypothetical protein